MNRKFLFLAILITIGACGQENAASPTTPASPVPPTVFEKPRPVSSAEAETHLVSRLKCAYPARAKSMGITGTVKVKVLIDERGRVTGAKAVAGNPALRSAGVSCAELSTYSPFLNGGKATPVVTEVDISFPPVERNVNQQNTYLTNRTTANSLLAAGNPDRAVELYSQNLDLAERENPKNQMEFADAAGELGHIYLKLGKNKEAEDMIKKALGAFEAANVTDGPKVARSAEELGGIYLQQKEYTQAKAMFSRALPILTKSRITSSSPEMEKFLSDGISRALFGLASANFQSGDLKQAGIYCDRTIAETKNSPVSSSDLKNIYASCAGVNLAMGKKTEAAALQKRADQIKLEVPKH